MKPFVLTMLNVPDVGHGVGLALVLQTPQGRTFLYDTGSGYPEGRDWACGHNSGRDLIAPFLRAHDITEIDGVIISHAHYDHFGGLLWLVEHLPIRTLIDNGFVFSGEADAHYREELSCYQRLRGIFQRRPGGYLAVQAGQPVHLDPELEAEIISPPAEFFCDPGAGSHENWNPPAHYMLNSNSLMLRIIHKNVVFLLPGDIEKADQARHLLPFVPAPKLKCDILIAPGHGLHTHPDFVVATQPRLVLVSLFARWLESCTAASAFSAISADVYITGRDGTISVFSDGEEFSVKCENEAGPKEQARAD